MKIGIFAERIGTDAGGMETYESGVIKGIASLNSINQYTIYGSAPKEQLQKLTNNSHFDFKPICVNSTWARYIYGLPFSLLKNPVDLLHVCMFPPLFSPVPYIYTVHDLAHITHPEFFPDGHVNRIKYLLEKGVQKSTHIISISEFTKQDILANFDIPAEKITVIYNGLDTQYKQIKDKLSVQQFLGKYEINSPYILYTGRIQARKNIVRLLQAFNLIKKKNKIPHKLVIVGKPDWEYREFEDELKKIDMGDDIIQLGHVESEALPYLYNGADVFVFPSFYEGFGFPPIEAMACGTPVVCSNATSLSEVVSDAALTVSPYDVEGFAKSIINILDDDKLRQSLIEKGLNRAKNFSWEKTAEQTLNVYTKVFEKLN